MSRKAGKIALGLGLITGAVTGLLFAPEEGKKIRTKLQKGDAKGILDDLKMMGEEIRDLAVEVSHSPQVAEALDVAKDKAAEAANIKREELDAFLQNANKKAEEFKKKAAKYVKEQKAILEKKTKKKSTSKKRSTASKKKTAPKKANMAKSSTSKTTTTKKKAAPKAKKATAKKTTAKKK